MSASYPPQASVPSDQGSVVARTLVPPAETGPVEQEPILPRPAWNDPARLQERLRQVKLALAATAMMGCGTPLDPRAVYGGPPIPVRSQTPVPESTASPEQSPKKSSDDSRPRPPYGAAPPVQGPPPVEPPAPKP